MFKLVKKNNFSEGSVNIPNEVLLKLIEDAGINENTVFEKLENGSFAYQNKDGADVVVGPNKSGDMLYLAIPNTPHGELVAYSYYEGEYNSLSVDLVDAENCLNTLVVVEDVSKDAESPSSYGISAYVYEDYNTDEYTEKITFTGFEVVNG